MMLGEIAALAKISGECDLVIASLGSRSQDPASFSILQCLDWGFHPIPGLQDSKIALNGRYISMLYTFTKFAGTRYAANTICLYISALWVATHHMNQMIEVIHTCNIQSWVGLHTILHEGKTRIAQSLGLFTIISVCVRTRWPEWMWVTYSRLIHIETVAQPRFEPVTCRSRKRPTNHLATVILIQHR